MTFNNFLYLPLPPPPPPLMFSGEANVSREVENMLMLVLFLAMIVGCYNPDRRKVPYTRDDNSGESYLV